MTKRGEVAKYMKEVVLPYEGDDCLTWPYAIGGGYAHIYHDGDTRLVSRLVCEAIYGPPPTPDHEAAHSCGRGHMACVAKRHLRWDTASGNQKDRLGHGTSNRGVRNGRAKLNPEKVREIKSLLPSVSIADLARRFDVHYGSIKQIVTGKAWGWVV